MAESFWLKNLIQENILKIAPTSNSLLKNKFSPNLNFVFTCMQSSYSTLNLTCLIRVSKFKFKCGADNLSLPCASDPQGSGIRRAISGKGYYEDKR